MTRTESCSSDWALPLGSKVSLALPAAFPPSPGSPSPPSVCHLIVQQPVTLSTVPSSQLYLQFLILMGPSQTSYG